MKEFRWMLVLWPIATIAAISCAIDRCEPDMPVDVGVTITPCPEAAAPTSPPSANPPPRSTYCNTEAEMEAVRMIDELNPKTATGDTWWKRMHELNDAAAQERARDACLPR